MNKLPFEIREINSHKIFFKSNYAWAFCLNANQENKSSYYSLLNNALNQQKLRKIFPNLIFSVPFENTFLFPSLELRDYQKEDVKFLSQLKNGAIFSEMRTGKTPVALMTFNQWSVNNLLIIVPGILQQQWQKSVEI